MKFVRFSPTSKTDGGGAKYIRWGFTYQASLLGSVRTKALVGCGLGGSLPRGYSKLGQILCTL